MKIRLRLMPFAAILLTVSSLSISHVHGTLKPMQDLKSKVGSIKRNKSEDIKNKVDDILMENFKNIVMENKNVHPNEEKLELAYSKIRANIFDDLFKNMSQKAKEWYLTQFSLNKEIGWKVFNETLVSNLKKSPLSKVVNLLNPKATKEKLERLFNQTLKVKTTATDRGTQLSTEVINYIVGLQWLETESQKIKLPLETIKAPKISNWQDPKQLIAAYRYYMKLALEAIQADLWEFNGFTEGFLQSKAQYLDQNGELKADAIRVRRVNTDSGANTAGLWLVEINKKYLQSDDGASTSRDEWKLKFVIKQHKNSEEGGPEEEQAALRIVSAPTSPLKNMPPKVLLGRGNDPITFLPKISFEEKLIKVSKGNEDPDYVSVLKAAKGQDLFELSALYDPKNTDLKPFQDYGEALSNFHQYFNVANTKNIKNPEPDDIFYTITHGDGHPRNIFYAYPEKNPAHGGGSDKAEKSDEKGRSEFIDNATMSISLQEKPPLENTYLFQAQPFGVLRNGLWRVSFLADITKFVYSLLFMYDPNKVKIPAKEDAPLLKQVGAFLISYVKTYPQDQQEKIWSLIKQDFDAKIPAQAKLVRKTRASAMTMCGRTEDNMIKYCRNYLETLKKIVEEGLHRP